MSRYRPDENEITQKRNELGTKEVIEHCRKVVLPLTDACDRVAKTGRISLNKLSEFYVMQGYLNGVIDALNSEDKVQPSDRDSAHTEYLKQLRLLLFPVRLYIQGELEKTLRKIKEDPPKGTSGSPGH